MPDGHFEQVMLMRIAQAFAIPEEFLRRPHWQKIIAERYRLYREFERQRRAAIRLAIYDAMLKRQVLAIYDRFL